MSKKVIHFSKGFVPCVILSVLLILSGIFALITKGLNLGIEFKAGLIEDIRIAPTALELTYSGPANVSVQITGIGMTVVVSGVGAENASYEIPYVRYRTVGEVASALNEITGVNAVVRSASDQTAVDLFSNSESSSVLGTSPFRLHYIGATTRDYSAEDVRNALSSMNDVSVKMVGDSKSNSFQIRAGDDGSDPEASKKIQQTIASRLSSAFGEDMVAVIKTDFIGSQFSSSLILQSIVLVAATLLLIWLYSTIRFRWDFALGAVLAITHDALIMVAFIAWTGLEMNSTMIAAILTIIGYSINDTIVVLDRVRENMKTVKVTKFTELLDLSQTEILGRTVITTVTTLLAVFALYIFTSGSMKEFALALIVGMISGVYSTIMIASAFIALVRRNWKPSDEEKKKPAAFSAVRA
ncbi:protein translocase subunit SecF [Treponema maltophilum]|uniref:protein translocase subunit SecF n=1 Tax=Treponema maltophilum TaxID=51160 RepID=UPI003D8F040D